jgi:hypothetical protein
MRRQTTQQGLVQRRAHLLNRVRNGDFDDDPSMLQTVVTAIKSPDPTLVRSVWDFEMVQDSFWDNLMRPNQQNPEPENVEPLFYEPAKRALDALHGDIYLGDTIPSGYPVNLSEAIFGSDNHTEIVGGSGAGKSSNIDSILVQLVRKGKLVFSFDTENAPSPFPAEPAQCDLSKARVVMLWYAATVRLRQRRAKQRRS